MKKTFTQAEEALASDILNQSLSLLKENRILSSIWVSETTRHVRYMINDTTTVKVEIESIATWREQISNLVPSENKNEIN